MSTINDGGPAWPTAFPAVHVPVSGMSMRDWFAGQALNAFIISERDPGATSWDPQFWADWAYLTADAMLAHRHRSTFTPTNDTPREKKLP